MPVPILGLVPQPNLEDWDAIGVSAATRDGVLDSCEVSIGYTLWRNPDDRDDPVNLAELDQEQREAVEFEPPWPRPRWLVERVQRMRYPMLWECVRTRWCRQPGVFDTVQSVLAAHVRHVLVNQFQEDRGRPMNERHVEPGVPVLVDGATREGFRVDTDPRVYGLGVELDAHTVLSAAIPRDALAHVRVAFAARQA